VTPLPTIAIVGRPNVGKSSLFNRLTGSRKALTHDLPGVTRDRVAGEAVRPAGGYVVVVDTGGFEPESEELFPSLVRRQALKAIAEADVVVLVVDGSAGVVPQDVEVAGVVRRLGAPVVLAVNKADRRDASLGAGEFSVLGFPVVSVSAEHGLGLEDLWEELERHLPPPRPEVEPRKAELAVAVVGRPNVGKSSLLNAILDEDRFVVSQVPGTTRDAVDTVVQVGGRVLRLVDTAGIRRRGRTDRGPEVLSVVMARRAMERAHVCLLVLDGGEGVTAQDAHIAGLALEQGRAAVVAINKADLLPAGATARRDLARRAVEALHFLKGTEVLFVSALTGAGVGRILPRVMAVGEAFHSRISTGELNRVLRAAWEEHPPPQGRKPARLYYATQVSTAPPTIVLMTSTDRPLHFSYLRQLENALRRAFPLAGVPIRFIMRRRSGRSA
jgi:GTP-binding protein